MSESMVADSAVTNAGPFGRSAGRSGMQADPGGARPARCAESIESVIAGSRPGPGVRARALALQARVGGRGLGPGRAHA